MLQFPVYQVDAFVTPRAFSGNPAAVCPLDAFLDDEVLQNIAASNNLSETAFIVRQAPGRYALRWMTPTVEVDLCGHATLASAHVIWTHLGEPGATLSFATRSGDLVVERGETAGAVMDFPANPGEVAPAPAPVVAATGGRPRETLRLPSLHRSACWMLVYDTAEEVAALAPDFSAMARHANVLATAPGTASSDTDFVVRFFAPDSGINEDPVTGSAYTWATPYWAERLGRSALKAEQISARGGLVGVEARGARVRIAGACRDFMIGQITLA